jgi:hypothetical protein
MANWNLLYIFEVFYNKNCVCAFTHTDTENILLISIKNRQRALQKKVGE